MKFAENWNIQKFVYGASLGYNEWKFNDEDEKLSRHLLSNFTGISFREKSSVKLVEKHLGFKSKFVLDPTLLINKKYYLNLINNYKSKLFHQLNNKEFIFAYILRNTNKNIKEYLSYVKKELNKPIFYLNIHQINQVKEFLYGLINCKAVITDSFHGTVFSIIFKKPFISFANKSYNECRFNNLDMIFNIRNRIFEYNSIPPVSLLSTPLVINKKNLILLKRESIRYLKKNLMQKQ